MKNISFSYIQNNNLFLTRFVKGRLRYYFLRIEKTLFGDFLLEKIYGSMNHKKPTRILKEYYQSWDEAKSVFDNFVKIKQKKGYHSNIV